MVDPMETLILNLSWSFLETLIAVTHSSKAQPRISASSTEDESKIELACDA